MKNAVVIVGMGSCGLAAGAGKVWEKLTQLSHNDNAGFTLSQTSCIGMCYREPLVEIRDAKGSVIDGDVDESRAERIIQSHVNNGEVISEWVVKSDYMPASEDGFFKGQIRIALRNCGIIDPGRIEHYISRGGYNALKKIAEEHIRPDAITDEVLRSGLRGRGGGGLS